MPVRVSAVPILAGKTNDWKAAMAEMKGARAQGYAESRKMHGVHREIASVQHTPMGDFVCVFLEADDPDGFLQRAMASDHPFDQWFSKVVLEECHGMTPDADSPPPNAVHLNWGG